MTRTFQKPIKRIVVKLGSSQIVDGKFKARRERLNFENFSDVLQGKDAFRIVTGFVAVEKILPHGQMRE